MSEAAQERRDAEHYAETGQRAVYHTTTSAHTGRPIVTKYFVSDDDDGGLADQFMEDVQHHDVGYGSPNDDDQGQEEHMQEEEQVDSSDSTTSNSDIDSDGSFANYDATADVKKAFQSALQRANYDATTDVKKASQRSLQKAHLHLLRSRGHSQRAPPARAVLRRHHPYGGAQGARGAGHKASRWNTETGMWEFSEPPSTSSPSVARRGHNATPSTLVKKPSAQDADDSSDDDNDGESSDDGEDTCKYADQVSPLDQVLNSLIEIGFPKCYGIDGGVPVSKVSPTIPFTAEALQWLADRDVDTTPLEIFHQAAARLHARLYAEQWGPSSESPGEDTQDEDDAYIRVLNALIAHLCEALQALSPRDAVVQQPPPPGHNMPPQHAALVHEHLRRLQQQSSPSNTTALFDFNEVDRSHTQLQSAGYGIAQNTRNRTAVVRHCVSLGVPGLHMRTPEYHKDAGQVDFVYQQGSRLLKGKLLVAEHKERHVRRGEAKSQPFDIALDPNSPKIDLVMCVTYQVLPSHGFMIKDAYVGPMVCPKKAGAKHTQVVFKQADSATRSTALRVVQPHASISTAELESVLRTGAAAVPAQPTIEDSPALPAIQDQASCYEDFRDWESSDQDDDEMQEQAAALLRPERPTRVSHARPQPTQASTTKRQGPRPASKVAFSSKGIAMVNAPVLTPASLDRVTDIRAALGDPTTRLGALTAVSDPTHAPGDVDGLGCDAQVVDVLATNRHFADLQRDHNTTLWMRDPSKMHADGTWNSTATPIIQFNVDNCDSYDVDRQLCVQALQPPPAPDAPGTLPLPPLSNSPSALQSVDQFAVGTHPQLRPQTASAGPAQFNGTEQAATAAQFDMLGKRYEKKHMRTAFSKMAKVCIAMLAECDVTLWLAVSMQQPRFLAYLLDTVPDHFVFMRHHYAVNWTCESKLKLSRPDFAQVPTLIDPQELINVLNPAGPELLVLLQRVFNKDVAFVQTATWKQLGKLVGPFTEFRVKLSVTRLYVKIITTMGAELLGQDTYARNLVVRHSNALYEPNAHVARALRVYRSNLWDFLKTQRSLLRSQTVGQQEEGRYLLAEDCQFMLERLCSLYNIDLPNATAETLCAKLPAYAFDVFVLLSWQHQFGLRTMSAHHMKLGGVNSGLELSYQRGAGVTALLREPNYAFKNAKNQSEGDNGNLTVTVKEASAGTTIADFDKAAKPMPSHRVTVGSNELCCPIRMLQQKLRVTEQLQHSMDEAWLDAGEDGPRQVREAAFKDPEAFMFSFAANEDGTRCLNMTLQEWWDNTSRKLMPRDKNAKWVGSRLLREALQWLCNMCGLFHAQMRHLRCGMLIDRCFAQLVNKDGVIDVGVLQGLSFNVNWADKRTAIHYLRGLQRAVWDSVQQKAIRSALLKATSFAINLAKPYKKWTDIVAPNERWFLASELYAADAPFHADRFGGAGKLRRTASHDGVEGDTATNLLSKWDIDANNESERKFEALHKIKFDDTVHLLTSQQPRGRPPMTLATATAIVLNHNNIFLTTKIASDYGMDQDTVLKVEHGVWILDFMRRTRAYECASMYRRAWATLVSKKLKGPSAETLQNY
jgi:hypothetical protein